MSTKRKRPAKKVASKQKSATRQQRPRARDMSSATASLMPTAEGWRRDRRRRSKEEVPGYDPTAFDIPGHFEKVAYDFKIWPFYTKADARRFECLQGEPVPETVYYKDADGHTKVATRRNGYYLAPECRSGAEAVAVIV